MALKRINKELTDLGRYVPNFPGYLVGVSSQPGINAGTETMVRIHRANEELAVILLHHAQQDLLVMIWYVHLLETEPKRAMASLAVPRLFIYKFRITN